MAEFKLGLTATTAETIRDFLRSDIAELERELTKLETRISTLSGALVQLHDHVNQMKEVTFDLLDECIQANANINIVHPNPKESHA